MSHLYSNKLHEFFEELRIFLHEDYTLHESLAGRICASGQSIPLQESNVGTTAISGRQSYHKRLIFSQETEFYLLTSLFDMCQGGVAIIVYRMDFLLSNT